MKRLSMLLVAAGLALSVAKPASADFLYDFVGAGTHEQFTVPALLTSGMTITSFSLASPGVVGLILNPVATGVCASTSTPGITIPGPCAILDENAHTNNVFFYFPTFTAVGSYNTFQGNPGTITISSVSVPEPATLALIGLGLSGLALTRRRRTQ